MDDAQLDKNYSFGKKKYAVFLGRSIITCGILGNRATALRGRWVSCKTLPSNAKFFVELNSSSN